MSVSAGSGNEQTVFVKNQPTIPYGDYIRYEIPYYWRVMVQEYNDDLSSDWIYYDGSQGTTNSELKTSYTYGYSHPAPYVNFNFLPEAPIIDEAVNFFGSSSVFFSSPLNYIWDFGDGSTLSGKTKLDVTHSYASQGTFPVTFQVCDEIDCCSDAKDVPIRNESGTELPKYKEVAPY